MHYLVGAIAAEPENPEPYAVVAELWRDRHSELTEDPTNWSLHLDLADLHARRGDFAAAVRSTDQGLRHEPSELTLRAARAAYRARLTGSTTALGELVDLATLLPNDSYRDLLIDYACASPALPDELVAAARRIQAG